MSGAAEAPAGEPVGSATPWQSRDDLLEETDRYLAELIEEVGEPSQQEVAEADEWCGRIARHLKRAPGTR